jgi:hypothetical protein
MVEEKLGLDNAQAETIAKTNVSKKPGQTLIFRYG